MRAKRERHRGKRHRDSACEGEQHPCGVERRCLFWRQRQYDDDRKNQSWGGRCRIQEVMPKRNAQKLSQLSEAGPMPDSPDSRPQNQRQGERPQTLRDHPRRDNSVQLPAWRDRRRRGADDQKQLCHGKQQVSEEPQRPAQQRYESAVEDRAGGLRGDTDDHEEAS